MRSRRHLVVFARQPVLGRVKTRLGRDIGPLAASRFYRQTVATVLGRLGRDRRWRCRLALSPDKAVLGRRFWPRSFSPLGQGPGDLGRRMRRVMKAMPPGPVVIVGTDVPAIKAGHIAAAFKALGDHDAVFGPAADGGYWLVGARRSPAIPDLFSGVRWSNEHTLADSLDKARKQGLKTALLEVLEDIDDGAAYAAYMCSLSRGINSTKLHGL